MEFKSFFWGVRSSSSGSDSLDFLLEASSRIFNTLLIDGGRGFNLEVEASVEKLCSSGTDDDMFEPRIVSLRVQGVSINRHSPSPNCALPSLRGTRGLYQ
ncbi:hypothetical protein V6N13_088375 [Hibiscus sabdariffa]